MTQQQFNDVQYGFLAVFGPVLPYLLLAMVVGMVTIIFLMLALALFRRMA